MRKTYFLYCGIHHVFVSFNVNQRRGACRIDLSVECSSSLTGEKEEWSIISGKELAFDGSYILP